MQSMKKLLILLLMFSISCNKDSSNPAPTGTETETTNHQVKPPTTSPTPTPSPTIPSTTESWTEEFMDLINNHRASIGLRALIHDDDMGEIARTHGQNMASGAVAFGHTGFSIRCSASKSALGGGNWCGENVAAGQTSPKAAFTSWMNSSGHRQILKKAAPLIADLVMPRVQVVNIIGLKSSFSSKTITFDLDYWDDSAL